MVRRERENNRTAPQQQGRLRRSDGARPRGGSRLRRSLWALAAKGNPAANIFLAKNLLGYRDYFRNEHSGPDGAPIAVKQDLSRLTDEELEQFDKILLRLDPNGNADGRQYLWKLDRWGRSVAHCVRSIQ